VSDHVRRREPIVDMGDTWITPAAIAVGSDGIRLGPMVTPLARRRPVKVGRETATLDRLSGRVCRCGSRGFTASPGLWAGLRGRARSSAACSVFPALDAHRREVLGVGLRGQQATLSPPALVSDPEWARSLDLRLAARSIASGAATSAARCSSTGGSSEETTWDRPGELKAAHDHAPHEPSSSTSLAYAATLEPRLAAGRDTIGLSTPESNSRHAHRPDVRHPRRLGALQARSAGRRRRGD
jgi:hypothetical protein